jgi:ATP synthase subunit 10
MPHESFIFVIPRGFSARGICPRLTSSLFSPLHTMNPRFVPVCVLLIALLLLPAAAQQFPHIEEQNLAGQQVVLPESVAGKVTVLVVGFSHASSKPTGIWAKRTRDEFGNNPGFALYQLAVIEEAPKFIHGMIISGMKKGTPDSELPYLVPVVHQEAELKKLVDFKEPDDAYIVVLDRTSKIVYQAHGDPDASGYADLRAQLAGLVK